MKTSPAAWGVSSLISIACLLVIGGFIWLIDTYEEAANVILLCIVVAGAIAAISTIFVAPVQHLLDLIRQKRKERRWERMNRR